MAHTKQVGRAVSLEDSKPCTFIDASKTRRDLCKLLDDIESGGGGSFVSCGAFNQAPLLGLDLQGFGSIPLPLAKRDADTLTKDRTGVDKDKAPRIERSVDETSDSGRPLPNQWEVMPKNFDIRNPDWHKFVERVAIKATKDMGVKPDAGPLKASKGSRLRLWTSGACLPPHKDSLRAIGRFGKLLICLPAEHRGGSLRYTYGGEKKKILTETFSPWGYSYVAWYDDVTVEFTPVSSGYRLMIEYDLIAPSQANWQPLVDLYSEKTKLRECLMTWNNNAKKDRAMQMSNIPTLLAYICDSHYPVENLGLDVLAGNDGLRGACLKDACSQIGIGVYIADVYRRHSGCASNDFEVGDDHHFIEMTEEDEITLTKIVDLYGNTVESDASLEEDEHFIQDDAFGYDPDEEDYDDYYATVTHHFRNTVLILVSSVEKGEWIPEKDKESRPSKRKRSVEVIDLE